MHNDRQSSHTPVAPGRTRPSPRPRRAAAVVVALLFVSACGTSNHQPGAQHAGATVPAPNLKETERVAVLAERARRADANLVFVGDSITYHWETAGKSIWEQYYGQRRALNLGVGWEQTENVLWRIEQGHFDRLRPRLVVLLIGTNNTQNGPHGPQEIADGVQAIIEGLRSKGVDGQILLLGIFPRGEERDNELRRNNEAANRLIAQLADGRSVHYRDIGAALTREDGSIDPEIMPDYLHLSTPGYALWAQAIEGDVRRLLGEDETEIRPGPRPAAQVP